MDLTMFFTGGLLSKQNTYLIVAVAILLSAGCEKTSIEPDGFMYPLQLNATVDGNVVTLSWTEVRVSNFSEYVILRSQETIDDAPAPDISGLTTVATRIDDLSETSFEDSSAPIAAGLYYKVYARIGERFLYSATLHVDIDLQLIQLRTDNFTVDTLGNTIIAFDRGIDVLFTYDYVTEQVLRQVTRFMTNPIIRFGEYNGTQEVYLCDHNNQIEILDRATLQLKQTMSTVYTLYDFWFVDGYFVVARDIASSGVAVYRRSTLSQASAAPSGASAQRLIAVGGTAADRHIYEFGLASAARYRLTAGGQISREQLITEALAGSQVTIASNVDASHYAVSSFGHIIDKDLNIVVVLDNGLVFHQLYAYAHDGSRLFSIGFDVSSPVLRSYLPEEDYAREKERIVSFTPSLMFADAGYLYSAGIVFINGASRTVVTKLRY